MAKCKLGEKGCWKDGKCHYSHDCENKVLTNADRIRAMSDEELADLLTSANKGAITDICRKMYYEHNLQWLKKPYEKGETNE